MKCRQITPIHPAWSLRPRQRSCARACCVSSGAPPYLGWAGVAAAVVALASLERSLFGPGIAPRQAHVKGIVTYRFPGQPAAMVQNDDTSTIVDTSRLGTLQFGPGDRIEFDGTCQSPGRMTFVLATTRNRRSAPRCFRMRCLCRGVGSRHRQPRGPLRRGRRDRPECGRGATQQRSAGAVGSRRRRWRFVALIADDGATDADTVVNARVSVRGVARRYRTTDGEVVHAQVLVPSRAQVRVTGGATARSVCRAGQDRGQPCHTAAGHRITASACRATSESVQMGPSSSWTTQARLKQMPPAPTSSPAAAQTCSAS